MAQRVQVLLTCDIDDRDDDIETVTFGYDGDSYSLELCDTHRDELAGALGGFIDAARREQTPRTQAPRARQRRPAAQAQPAPKQDLGEIREWGRANGYQVSDRGRILQP